MLLEAADLQAQRAARAEVLDELADHQRPLTALERLLPGLLGAHDPDPAWLSLSMRASTRPSPRSASAR